MVHRLLDDDPAHFGPDELETIRRHFATEIALVRAGETDVPYRELLGRVLDYRTWRRFELALVEADGREAPLTRARHARLSSGEKAASLHLPLFAAAHAAFAAARTDCPRLLALDEAFAGIDDQGRAELLSLTVAFDLDLFMTGFDLWATQASVPAVAHHDLLHLPDERAVSSLLVLVERPRAGRGARRHRAARRARRTGPIGTVSALPERLAGPELAGLWRWARRAMATAGPGWAEVHLRAPLAGDGERHAIAGVLGRVVRPGTASVGVVLGDLDAAVRRPGDGWDLRAVVEAVGGPLPDTRGCPCRRPVTAVVRRVARRPHRPRGRRPARRPGRGGAAGDGRRRPRRAAIGRRAPPGGGRPAHR